MKHFLLLLALFPFLLPSQEFTLAPDGSMSCGPLQLMELSPVRPRMEKHPSHQKYFPGKSRRRMEPERRQS